MLLQLGIKYDSEEGIEKAEEVMSYIAKHAQEASQVLAEKRGVFPAWKGSVWQKKGIKIRNSALTTVAPTGTLSFVGNCSPGIEPIFAVAYTRNVLDNNKLIDVNSVFEKVARDRGFYSKDLMKELAEGADIQEVEEIPDVVKDLFVTSHDIDPEYHIRMQAAFQKYVDAGISKTVNFPNSATKEDVKKAYLLAYKLKLKGLTIYRDGSRNQQVMEKGKKKEDKKDQNSQTVQPTKVKPRKRPNSLIGYTYKTKTSYGNLYITINEDKEGKPFEMFANIGKAGGFFAAKAEAISRLVSLALRSRINVKEVIHQLKGIRGPQPTWGDDGKIHSLPDAVAQTLEKYVKSKEKGQQLGLNFDQPTDIEEEDESEKEDNQPTLEKGSAASTKSIADIGEVPACPECGGMLEFSEGCMSCPGCGYSKCS
jgi:ribonucleoside-diphosphate reductase alpha chain